MTDDYAAKRLFWFIFAGSRGGLTRLKIISSLKENSSNTNQLAKELELDYKAVQHHIRILEKNNLIIKSEEKYGATYSLSSFLKINMEAFSEIATKLDKSK